MTEPNLSDYALTSQPQEIAKSPIGGGMLPSGPDQACPIQWLAKITDWALVLAAAIMIVLVFFNVCIHALGKDMAFTTEACELLMVWVTFLGGASIVRRSGHMTITEFIDKLDFKHRLVADFIIQSIAFVALAILFWNGLLIIGYNWTNILTVLQIPMAWQYMPLAIGSGISMVFVAYDIYKIIQGKSRQERYGEDD